uniref:F-box domain-containing protein n=1 Tax=Anopheles atroparvus TaxID=41427 RepID=A0AAG5DT14_ANOAO
MIFDWLDLNSIKNASLACHRWERIIFSNHYIKRFTFRSLLSNNSTKHEMKQMARLMKVSHRCYPNLKLEFDHQSEYTEHAFHVLFRSMSCRMLDQLVVLKLVLTAFPDLMLQMVFNAVPEMSRLAALHLMVGNRPCQLDERRYKYELHLKSDSLRYLELKAFLPGSLNLPLLKSLDMSLHMQAEMIYSCHRHLGEEMLYSAHFENLEELTFSQPSSSGDGVVRMKLTNRPGYKLRFYQQLTRLKTLRLLEDKTSECIFQAICESCTSLTELHIECLQIVDPNAPRHLSKLPHLRRLTLNSFVAPAPISFESTHLPHLEHLRLGRGSFAYDSFHAFGAVQSLALALTQAKHSGETMRAIAQHLPNVTVLRLNLEALGDLDASALLHSLHLLTTVRELVLEGGYFHASTCEPNTLPMPELQKLHFRHYRMHSRELPWLRRMFPNLALLDMRQCPAVPN